MNSALAAIGFEVTTAIIVILFLNYVYVQKNANIYL